MLEKSTAPVPRTLRHSPSLDPAAPVRVSSFATGFSSHQVVVNESVAYVVGALGGLAIVAGSNPLAPTELGRYTPPTGREPVGIGESLVVVG